MSADFGKSTELWLVQQLRHRRARFTRRKHQLLGFCDRRRQEVKRMPRSIPAQLHGLDFQGTALTTHAARCAAVQKQPHVRHERHNGSMTWESFELATEIKSHWVACADLELCQTSLFFSTEKITTLDPETKVHTVPSNPYGYFWQVQKACDRLSCVCTFKHWQNGGRPKAQVTPHMLSEKILWDIESEVKLTLDKIVLVQPLWKELISIEKEGNSVGVCCVCLNSKSRHESTHYCPIKSFWLFLTGAKSMWPAFLCLHLQTLAKWWKTESARHSAYAKRENIVGHWKWKAESTLDKIVLVQPFMKRIDKHLKKREIQ